MLTTTATVPAAGQESFVTEVRSYILYLKTSVKRQPKADVDLYQLNYKITLINLQQCLQEIKTTKIFTNLKIIKYTKSSTFFFRFTQSAFGITNLI